MRRRLSGMNSNWRVVGLAVWMWLRAAKLRRHIFLGALEDGSQALAAADAHGLQPIAAIAPVKFTQQIR